MIKRIASFIALAAALAACAGAASWKAHRPLYYLSPAQLQFPAFPTAPAAGSDVDRADLKTLHEWQARRTPAQCARARSEAEETFDEFFGGVSPFSRPTAPEAEAILERVHADALAAVSVVKKRNKRERPFRRDPSLEPCLRRIGGFAYPSGHATVSHVFGRLLSDLEPRRKDEFMTRSDEAALDRVIGGVHHPSDIEAGKRFGDEVYQDLLASPAFRDDLGKLRRLLESR